MCRNCPRIDECGGSANYSGVDDEPKKMTASAADYARLWADPGWRAYHQEYICKMVEAKREASGENLEEPLWRKRY
jgi:hypothetical protein